ncbi:alpha/beta hydrolase [Flavisolibacter sp. BT320]|nr:alpha/beta hydrolase [Flavisolibacter longurius]
MKTLLFISCCFVSAVTVAQEAKHTALEQQHLGHVIAVNNLAIRNIKLSTGVELEYAEQGETDGVPVILLHGFTDSWKSFSPVLPYLPPSLHVFALSQRGHGNSSKNATQYRPQDFADDVSAFMQAKGIAQAIIVGHSMGSTNAQCFVTRYPQRAKALVLIGTFADYNKPILTEFKTVIDDLHDPIDSTFIAEFQKSTLTRPIDGDMLQTFIAESRKVPTHVWKGVAAGWQSATFLQALSSFRKPTLIIWGEKDTYSTLDDQVRLQAVLQQARFLKHEGIGHANHWEAPERFARDLVNFIQKSSTPSP